MSQGEVVEIELWRNESEFSSDWFCDVITFFDMGTGLSVPNFHYRIKVYDTTLPQDDLYPEHQKVIKFREFYVTANFTIWISWYFSARISSLTVPPNMQLSIFLSTFTFPIWRCNSPNCTPPTKVTFAWSYD